MLPPLDDLAGVVVPQAPTGIIHQVGYFADLLGDAVLKLSQHLLRRDHEPLRRSFEEIIVRLSNEAESLREPLTKALGDLKHLANGVGTSGIASPSMSELGERVSRSRTAIQNWLDVDDTLARQEYPDAQTLLDRMRVASQRWPNADALPIRVNALAERVEAYYESGENPREWVL